MNSVMKWFAVVFFVVSFTTTSFAQAISGVMMVVKGDIKVTSKDGKTEAAKVGKKVVAGDTITSGPDSRAKIVMADKNVINVSPDSKIVIEKYENDGKDKKNVELNVVYGKLRASVEQKYDGEKSKFNVKTPSAVAGVRGTDFITGYNPSTKSAQIITFQGSVAVGTPGPGGSIQNPVFVKAGQMTEAGAGKPPEAPKSVPKEELNKMNNETKAETAGNDKKDTRQVASESKEEKKDEKKEAKDEKKDEKKEAKDEKKDAKEERKEEKKEAKEEKKDAKEDRKEAKDDKKDSKKEAREDQKDAKKEAREERKEEKKEAKEERKDAKNDKKSREPSSVPGGSADAGPGTGPTDPSSVTTDGTTPIDLDPVAVDPVAVDPVAQPTETRPPMITDLGDSPIITSPEPTTMMPPPDMLPPPPPPPPTSISCTTCNMFVPPPPTTTYMPPPPVIDPTILNQKSATTIILAPQ